MSSVDPELVRRIAEKVAAELSQQASPAPGRTLAQLWDEWAPVAQSKKGWRNKASDRRYMDLRFPFGGRDVCLAELRTSEITPHLLEAWRAALIAYRSPHTARPIAPGTRQRIRMSIQAMLTYHARMGSPDVPRNPFSAMPDEEGHQVERQGYFSEEDFEQFCSHCVPVVAALLRTSFRCGGLRNAEVRLLRKSEVNWQAKELTLRQKGGGWKTVIVTDDIMELLRHWAGVSPSEFVFANPRDPRGLPMPATTLWKWVDKARKSWGKKLGPTAENPTTHHTRHSYTMAMLEKGAPETWVSQQLGHRSLAQMARYGRLRGRAKAMMRDLANKTVAEVEAERLAERRRNG